MSYRFKNVKQKRGKTKGIVIVTLPNLIEMASHIDPDILVGSTVYTWGEVQKYFFREVVRESLPMHYSVELVDKDYAIYTGEALTVPSYFLQELAAHNVIPYTLQDSICVCVMENFNIDIPDNRMWDLLAHRVITPLMRTNGLDEGDVTFLDEIVNWDTYKVKHREKKVKFLMGKSKRFDRIQLISSVKKYSKR